MMVPEVYKGLVRYSQLFHRILSCGCIVGDPAIDDNYALLLSVDVTECRLVFLSACMALFI